MTRAGRSVLGGCLAAALCDFQSGSWLCPAQPDWRCSRGTVSRRRLPALRSQSRACSRGSLLWSRIRQLFRGQRRHDRDDVARKSHDFLDRLDEMSQEELDLIADKILPTLLSRSRKLRDELRPNRIILVRHGESKGNKDRSAYAQTPDSRIPLTHLGVLQGEAAGKSIRQLIGNESARLWYSPYMRTRQTLNCILKAFTGKEVEVNAEPRMREQDFGNFQDVDAMTKVFVQRKKFGRFFFRFPEGEAGTDVYDRVCDFWLTLFRSMDNGQPVDNFILVTHGLLMRIFCMVYFHWTVEEFEQVWNPSNCEVWALEKVPGTGSYQLAGRWRPSPKGPKFVEVRFGAKRNQPLWKHMKVRGGPRRYVPGSAACREDPRFAHLSTDLDIYDIDDPDA